MTTQLPASLVALREAHREVLRDVMGSRLRQATIEPTREGWLNLECSRLGEAVRESLEPELHAYIRPRTHIVTSIRGGVERGEAGVVVDLPGCWPMMARFTLEGTTWTRSPWGAPSEAVQDGEGPAWLVVRKDHETESGGCEPRLLYCQSLGGALVVAEKE